jgi:hypothetical protein
VHVLKSMEGRCVLCYCMSVCISVRAHLLLCAFLLFVCVFVFVFVCLCAYVFVCLCVCVFLHIFRVRIKKESERVIE